MGFFDFLDARKALARNVAKFYRKSEHEIPGTPPQEILALHLSLRYRFTPMNSSRRTIFEVYSKDAHDIFGYCHMLAEMELLNHLNLKDRLTLEVNGENVVWHTYRIIDEELILLGFSKTPRVSSTPPPYNPVLGENAAY